MLDLTAKAEVDGIKFDGVDLFLFDPHISIDIDDDGLKTSGRQGRATGFVVGSVVAPVWPPTGGGSAMGSDEDRKKFVEQVRKACRIASKLRELGVRPYGVVRIDSACGAGDWAKDPEANQRRSPRPSAQACDVAEEFGERLAAEGEICWGGMHSWKKMVRPAGARGPAPDPRLPGRHGSHAPLHAGLQRARGRASCRPTWDWSMPSSSTRRYEDADGRRCAPGRSISTSRRTTRPCNGSGTHDKTGHHCLPNDPNGKLDIAHHAGYWLHGDDGKLTKAIRHICWDGCMFPNAVMMKPRDLERHPRGDDRRARCPWLA